MMGPEKLGTIRAKLREEFKMSNVKLLAAFNQKIEEARKTPKRSRTELDTLRLLRDALVAEAKKRPTAPRKRAAGARRK
jgi:hypothetical protein